MSNESDFALSLNNSIYDGSTRVECPLVGFLPFTMFGSERPFFGLGNETVWAYTHLAAALIAVDHFNSRNPTIVQDLASLSNCSAYLPDPVFANTNFGVADVATFLVEEAYVGTRFCGIVGPYGNDPAREASHLAAGLDIPMITHGADDIHLSSAALNPRTARTSVNLHAMGEAVINWFRNNNRVDFIVIIGVTQEFGEQYRQTVDNAAKESGFTRTLFLTISPPFTGFDPNRGMGYAMRETKRSGFRNIFLILTGLSDQLQVAADYAEEFQLNTGDYVWMISGNIDLAELSYFASTNANVSKLVHGMSAIRAADGFTYNPPLGITDPFLEAWKLQNSSMVDRANVIYPIKRPHQVGYYQAPPDYFQTKMPEQGAAFMYDAVIAIGIGKCKELEGESATQQRRLTTAKGGGRSQAKQWRGVKGAKSPRQRALKKAKINIRKNDHLEAILSATFHGATGDVAFGENNGRDPGNRVRGTVTYGVYNIRAIEEPEMRLNPEFNTWFYLTDFLQGGSVDGTWTTTSPFIFGNGLTTPPELNRDIPDQNHLGAAVQALGLTFMSIAIVLILAATTFIFLNQTTAPIRHAQPPFLYVLMLGSLSMTLSILTLSFDEGRGWSDKMLDNACLAAPCLISLGYISIYSALFMKLWRINKVLQFSRRKVEIRQVVAPFVAVGLCAVAVLVAWLVVDPFTWTRVVVNDDTGETYGRCSSEHSIVFLVPLVLLMTLSTFACAVMAWLTKDVDDRFSESRYIFYTIFTQMQVLILGIPILIILGQESADATYLGRSLLIFVVVVTVVVLMIGPKVVAIVQQNDQETDSSHGARRGSIGVTHISGISGVRNHSAS